MSKDKETIVDEKNAQEDVNEIIEEAINSSDELEDTLENQEKEEKKSKKKAGFFSSKSAIEIEDLKEQIEDLTEEKAELLDSYKRLNAEFLNFKKRTRLEKLDLLDSAAKDTIVKLLPIVDDFQRAKNADGLPEGINLIYEKLMNTMTNLGLTEMETPVGATFDSEFHEAVAEIPVTDEDAKGKLVDTVEKGYLLNEKIIRFAKVVTGK